jgi:hypothetical protein
VVTVARAPLYLIAAQKKSELFFTLRKLRLCTRALSTDECKGQRIADFTLRHIYAPPDLRRMDLKGYR